MLDVTAAAVADRPVVLMGSSLGGFVAGQVAARHPDLAERVVLLAPALEFAKRWQRRFEPGELADWRSRRWSLSTDYGSKGKLVSDTRLVEDALTYEAEPALHATRADSSHGTADDVVPVALSRDYASRHPNCQPQEFASGHELTDVTEALWQQVASFSGTDSRRPPARGF